MKSLPAAAFAAVMLLLMLSAGCTLNTPTSIEPRPVGGSDLIINEVFTISPDKYYAYSWIELYNPSPQKIRWFEVTKPASGFTVGSGGEILRTSDDGKRWIDSLSGASYGNLNSISFANPETAFAAGDAGKILKITKRSVTVLNSGIANNLHSVAAVPDAQNRTAFAVGDNGRILRTIDRGLTWTVSTPTPRNLRSVFFVSFRAIYAVGDSGTVLQSANSGGAWAPKNVPEPYRPYTFYSVNFVSDQGWITGENGTILASTNAGGLWLPETSNVGATLRAGFFSPRGEFVAGQGWVVGDSGTILKTTNSGAKWEKKNSGVQTTLNSVTFVDSAHGWAFGDGGLILRTTNGGDSWLVQQSTTTSNLHGSGFLPLLVMVSRNYKLQMVAQRREFYFDPASGLPNFNYFTRIDSGVLTYDPLLLEGFGLPGPPDVAPGSFAVIVSDSDKFKDHTNLGPGDGAVIPNGIGYYIDPSRPGQFGFFHGVLWTLLPSSEIRLVKYFITQVIAGGQVLGFDSTVVDVVRWGNYRPSPDPWPNNQPAGFIPEWYSLARYSDDFGGDPNTENSSYSFYMAKVPIPRWPSQLTHKSRP